MRHIRNAAAAVLLATVASTLTACGSGTLPASAASCLARGGSNETRVDNGTGRNDPTAAPAAALRANFVQLLREHVALLVTYAENDAVSGVGSPAAKYVKVTLRDNAASVQQLLAVFCGRDTAGVVRREWDGVDHADAAYVDAVLQQSSPTVRARRIAAARAVAQLELAVDALAGPQQGALVGQNDTLLNAVRGVLLKSSAAARDEVSAADASDALAAALASAIDREQRLPGDATGPGASVRARLTGLFVQNAAQTAAVLQALVATLSPYSAQSRGAAAAVAASTAELAAAIPFGDPRVAAAFGHDWSGLLADLMRYSTGFAAGDVTTVTEADSDMTVDAVELADAIAPALATSPDLLTMIIRDYVAWLQVTARGVLERSVNSAPRLAALMDRAAAMAATLSARLAAAGRLA
jgi:hypothetical protein